MHTTTTKTTTTTTTTTNQINLRQHSFTFNSIGSSGSSSVNVFVCILYILNGYNGNEKKKIYNDEKVSKEEIFHWNKIIILHMDGYINDVFLTIFFYFFFGSNIFIIIRFISVHSLPLPSFFSLSLNYINGNKQIIIYIALQQQQ